MIKTPKSESQQDIANTRDNSCIFADFLGYNRYMFVKK